MARKKAKKRRFDLAGLPRRLWRWARRAALALAIAVLLAVLLFSFTNPPQTLTMRTEAARLGQIRQVWVNLEDIDPVMARSAVAAEDANFCLHWGFDIVQIRQAIAEGGGRGASTISQQTAKNVFLWQGRSWVRKGLETGMTLLIEALWSKRRILEVYLNVAEFDEGVFGIEAAAQHHFGHAASALTADQAARLAAVLPNPKARSAIAPSDAMQRRARAIADGAATIRGDGRTACFED